jgi:Protein of unknown function (DUF2933)
MNMLKMCWNWKVLAGLGAVAMAMYVVAPNAILGILPILALLACPLSMIVMMLGMRGMGGMRQGQAGTHGHPAPQTTGAPLTREQQLAQLRSQLLSLGEQQTSLASQSERLEMAEAASALNGAAQPAESVAHVAAPQR